MEEFEKEQFAKAIKNNLDYIEEKTRFEQSMGEREQAVHFADGFADDLAEICSKDDEQLAREDEEYYQELFENIKENIKENNTLIISADSYILEDFLKSDGTISMEAVYKYLASDCCKTYEEFKEKKYWDMPTNGYNGWLDLFVINPKTLKRSFLFTLSTKINREDSWISDLVINLSIVRDKLFGEKSLFGNNDEDLSWKQELWKDTQYFDEIKNTKIDFFKNFGKDFEKIFEHYQEILLGFKKKLEELKFSYKDEELWDIDMGYIEDYINTHNTIDTIYKNNRGDRFRKPLKFNTIGCQDMANETREWVKEFIGIDNILIRIGTKEERDESSREFFEKLDARIPDHIKEKRKEEKRIMPDTREHFEKYDVPIYGGKYY